MKKDMLATFVKLNRWVTVLCFLTISHVAPAASDLFEASKKAIKQGQYTLENLKVYLGKASATNGIIYEHFYKNDLLKPYRSDELLDLTKLLDDKKLASYAAIGIAQGSLDKIDPKILSRVKESIQKQIEEEPSAQNLLAWASIYTQTQTPKQRKEMMADLSSRLPDPTDKELCRKLCESAEKVATFGGALDVETVGKDRPPLFIAAIEAMQVAFVIQAGPSCPSLRKKTKELIQKLTQKDSKYWKYVDLADSDEKKKPTFQRYRSYARQYIQLAYDSIKESPFASYEQKSTSRTRSNTIEQKVYQELALFNRASYQSIGASLNNFSLPASMAALSDSPAEPLNRFKKIAAAIKKYPNSVPYSISLPLYAEANEFSEHSAARSPLFYLALYRFSKDSAKYRDRLIGSLKNYGEKAYMMSIATLLPYKSRIRLPGRDSHGMSNWFYFPTVPYIAAIFENQKDLFSKLTTQESSSLNIAQKMTRQSLYASLNIARKRWEREIAVGSKSYDLPLAGLALLPMAKNCNGNTASVKHRGILINLFANKNFVGENRDKQGTPKAEHRKP